MISKPVYNPFVDGNVFKWVLKAAQMYREMKKVENNAAKKTTEIIKKLDGSKMEDQKW